MDSANTPASPLAFLIGMAFEQLLFLLPSTMFGVRLVLLLRRERVALLAGRCSDSAKIF
jgi:hypothetical protein